MKTNIIIFIIILFLIISLLLLLIVKNKDRFKNENANNDGKMTFNYLKDNNNTKNILNKYYMNDDTKINGTRIVYHPYQQKNFLNLYGNPHNQWSTMGIWGGFDTFAEYMYNQYGVRR
jgi:hypothetical protein